MVLVSILGYRSTGSLVTENTPNTTRAAKMSAVIIGRLTEPSYKLIIFLNWSPPLTPPQGENSDFAEELDEVCCLIYFGLFLLAPHRGGAVRRTEGFPYFSTLTSMSSVRRPWPATTTVVPSATPPKSSYASPRRWPSSTLT